MNQCVTTNGQFPILQLSVLLRLSLWCIVLVDQRIASKQNDTPMSSMPTAYRPLPHLWRVSVNNFLYNFVGLGACGGGG